MITAVPQALEILLERHRGRSGADRTVSTARAGTARCTYLPMRARRILFRSVLERFGGHLETITCGGARLPAELQLAWEAMGIRIVQGYGATECATIAGHSPGSRRPGTVGPPLAETAVRIEADGELVATGPNVMLGLLGEARGGRRAVLRDGWAYTGDAAEIDPHGELVILGRTRDRIALPNGLKVYPEDLEARDRGDRRLRRPWCSRPHPGSRGGACAGRRGCHRRSLEGADRTANDGSLPTSGSAAGSAGRTRTSRAPTPSRSGAARLPRGIEAAGRAPPTRAAAGDATPGPGAATGADGRRPSPGPNARPRRGGPASRRSGRAATAEDLLPALIDLLRPFVEASGIRLDAPLGPLRRSRTSGRLARAGGTCAAGRRGVRRVARGPGRRDRRRDVAALAELIVARRGAAPPPEPSRWAHSPPPAPSAASSIAW